MSKEGPAPKDDDIGSTMATFVRRMKESTEDMKKAMAAMEKDSSDNITAQFGRVNDTYQANKDLVNEFVVLIYNQIKNTFESNFQIFKNQAQRVHENDIFVMKSNQKAFTTQLEEAFKKFEAAAGKFSRDMHDAFEHLKQAKLDSIDLVVNELEHRVEFVHLDSLSGLGKVLDEFTTSVLDSTGKINKDVREKFKTTSKFYRDGFQHFTNQVTMEYTQLVNDHADNVANFKSQVTAGIAKMAESIKAAEDESIRSIEGAMKSAALDGQGKIDAQQARIVETSKKQRDEIDLLTSTVTSDVERVLSSLSGSRAELDSVLKSDKPDGSRLKKDITDVIGTVDILIKAVAEHREKVQASNEGVKGIIEAGNAAISKEIKQVPAIMQKTIVGFKHDVEGKHNAINKAFLSSLQGITTGTGLFTAVDDQLASIKRMSGTVSTEFGKVWKAYDDVLEKSLDQLETSTTGIITKLGGTLKSGLATLEQEIQDNARLNLERVKANATTIVTGTETTGKDGLPALEHATKAIVDMFSEGLMEIKEKYRMTFTGAYGALFSSFDDMVVTIGHHVKDYGDKQRAIVKEHERENRALIATMETARDAQMREFNDRLQLDLKSLLDANQDLISRIMIKSAETGSEFTTISDDCLKQSQASLKSFLEKVQSTVSAFIGTIK